MDSSYCSIEMLQRYLHCAFQGLLKVSQLLLDLNQLTALPRKLSLLSRCRILSLLHTKQRVDVEYWQHTAVFCWRSYKYRKS